MHIKNKHNLPDKGPFIIVSNHTSFLDSVLIGYVSPIPLYYIGKEELFRNKLFSFIIRQCGAVPVSRTKNGGGSGLIKIINIIKSGGAILFFPEGTRSIDNKLLPAKSGTGFIIYHSGAPVVPVFIKGLHGLREKETLFSGPKTVSMIIGKPVLFNKDSYDRISSRVMEEIKNLGFILD